MRHVLLGLLLLIGSPALAGDFNPIEIVIEGGMAEVVIELDPPDAPAFSETFHIPLQGQGFNEEVSFGDANAGAGVQLFLEVRDFEPTSSIDFAILYDAGQSSDAGYRVEARVRSIEPLRFRLLETARYDFFFADGSLDIVPISGAFDGNEMCAGTSAIAFDEIFTLFPGEPFVQGDRTLGITLEQPDTPEVAFVSTSSGDLRVEGVSTDDEDNESSSFNPGSIEPGSFVAIECTSSGLVDGASNAAGEVFSQGNGVYTVTVIADSIATQPAGYQGSCFIGAIADGVVLELAKPKAFITVRSGEGSIALSPITGSIQGSLLSPGRYAIGFNASAFLSPGQTSNTSTIDWTLELRPPPCSAADLANPSGVLDFSDVTAYLTALGVMDPMADLAPPMGVYDFTDVLAFLTHFASGCP